MNNNIFVSIATYRDDLCIRTINDLYLKAKFPNNIYLGICQQNNNEIDMDCINNNSHIIKKYKDNIRIIRIPYYDAKGPIYARYLCSSLIDFNNEKYYLQIDSHSCFIKNWDIILINMIKEIIDKGLSKKPIISYYPKDILVKDNKELDNINIVPIIYNLDFNKNKKIFTLGTAIYTNTKGKYIKTQCATGGMIFSYSSLLKEVPFDPTLDYLFIGEEILNSIKFFTYGYDIFSPKINVIYHVYIRNDKPKYWNEKKIIFNDNKALNKVRYYLFNYNINNNNPYYNNYKLGTIRNINDYYNFLKIDINKYKKYLNKNNYLILFLIILLILIIIRLIYFAFQFFL
jgi:hypothetical protein